MRGKERVRQSMGGGGYKVSVCSCLTACSNLFTGKRKPWRGILLYGVSVYQDDLTSP